MSFDLERLNRRGAIALAAALATGTVANGLLVPARAAAKRARQLLGIRTNLSASADAFEIGCDLTRALVLGKKYFYELFDWAAGLPHFREHILLFEDAFVVIFSKLAKELRSVRECREVEITASCLEA
jgi:hypothetical protein